MSQGIVPKVGDRGTFTLKTPWVINTNTEFTCHAIRSFTELSKNNINVYNMFYKPKGLSEAIYSTDSSSGVLIVALRSSNGSFIYVPSSYILSIPNMEGYAYARRIVSIELGALPVGLSTDAIRADIADMITNRFGVVPTVREVTLPINEVVTPDNHAALEAGRQGLITENATTDALYKALLAKYTLLEQDNAALTAKLVELGVVTV